MWPGRRTFVASFLEKGDEPAEAAAVALGESRSARGEALFERTRAAAEARPELGATLARAFGRSGP